MLLVSAAVALARAMDLLTTRGWAQAAEVATPDLLHDTFNGLLAFIVPGPDDYSVAQGVSTVELGGVDLGVTDILIATLDETTPFLPQFSATVAGFLMASPWLLIPRLVGNSFRHSPAFRSRKKPRSSKLWTTPTRLNRSLACCLPLSLSSVTRKQGCSTR